MQKNYVHLLVRSQTTFKFYSTYGRSNPFTLCLNIFSRIDIFWDINLSLIYIIIFVIYVIIYMYSTKIWFQQNSAGLNFQFNRRV